jgi:phage terminase large subunit
MYQQTTATKKIASLRKRIRGVAGGTSASKTISILLWLIDYAQTHENQLISVVSESFPHLKRGAMRDFVNIMEAHNYFKADRWNKTDYTYTFETNTKMEFFSADQPGKVRGPRRHILFLNEANNIPYETFTQLEVRTEKIIWLDWNPVSEFWWYTEILPTMDVDFLTLTYKDNEALPESIVKAIEARKDKKNWWRVYGEGQLGEAEGRIYTGWIQIDEIPDEARLKRKGLDFGFSNDPAALIDVYVWNNGFIWDELLYRRGMQNNDLAAAIKQGEDALIIADSARPDNIAELASYGLSVLPSKKGKDSVLYGIQYVQGQQIYVTKRSLNIWKEYRNYLWLTDVNGKGINTPQDFLNHALDAGRYAMESLRPHDEEEDYLPTEQLFDPDTGLYI